MEVEPDVIPLLEEAIKSRNKMQIKEKNGGLAIEYVEKAMSRFANRMARLARHSALRKEVRMCCLFVPMCRGEWPRGA